MVCSENSFGVYCTLLFLFPIGLSPFHTKNDCYKDNFKEKSLSILKNSIVHITIIIIKRLKMVYKVNFDPASYQSN